MKMKKLVCFFLAGLMALSGVGCGKSGGEDQENPSGGNAAEENEDTDEIVEITIGNWPNKESNAAQYETAEKQKESFEDMYPYIKIITDEYTYSVDTFLPKAAANQLPDLFQTYMTEVDKIVNAGYAADLTEVMEEYGYLDNLDDKILESVTRDGKTYFVPCFVYTLGLMGNVAIFEEAGELNEDGTIPWPQTWEELGEMAGRIKAKTGKIGFDMPTMNNQGGWIFMSIAWSYGASFMTQEDGKWVATFDSDECAAALQFIKDLRWKYDALSDNLFIDQDEYFGNYGSEQAALTVATPGYGRFENFITQYGMDPEHISVGQLPAGPEGRYTLSGGNVYMIPASVSEEKYDAIFKWLAFTGYGPTMSEEAKENYEQSLINYTEKDVPILSELMFNIWKSGDVFEIQTELSEKHATANMDYFKDYLDFSDMTIKAEEPVCVQDLYSILDNCIQEVIGNEDADVKEVLKKAANDFQVNYLDNAE